MSSIEHLQRALDGATAMARNVNPADLGKPTPCSEWDVKGLVNHMAGVCYIFARGASGEQVTEYPAPTDLVGSDPAGAYSASASAAMTAWRNLGSLDQVLTLPPGQLPGTVAIQINFVDQLLHTHDLAKAIGRDYAIEPDLAEAAMAAMQMLITPERRGPGKPFGEAIEVAANASIQDKLVAFSGRQP